MSGPAFLGHGLLTPFRREGQDFVHGGGVDLVRASLEVVLGTRCAGPAGESGEIPWRQEFGSRLNLLRHRNLDAVTEALAKYYSGDALDRWEPRVVIVSTEVEKLIAENKLRIRPRFRLITKDRPDNLVTTPAAEAEVIL